jgi:UDP-2,3-diacylglucosamine hydrolase
VQTAGGFESQCAAVLREASSRLDLYVMAGNRDFLMGPVLMQACNAVLLDDPAVLNFGDTRIALTHGDALCLGDTDYQQFRKMVRGRRWQAEFLAQSLGERQAIARGIRAQSESHKRAETTYADVDATAALAQLDTLSCQHMVHGHTHKPGVHALGGSKYRSVLSDWDSASSPQRGDVLRLQLNDAHAPQWSRLTPSTASGPAC